MTDYNRELSYSESEARFADLRAAREKRRRERGGDSYDDPSELDGTRAKGSLLRVVLTQIVICALLLGGAYLCQRSFPGSYRQLRAAYLSAMRTDLSVKEVFAGIRQAFASLRDEVYVMAPYDGQKAESEEPEIGVGGRDEPLDMAAKNCTVIPLMTTAAPARPIREGRLTSAFGQRTHPVSGEESIHTGIDIGADMGEPVSAAFYGKILRAREDPEYGKYILMEHSGGLRTLYGHCSELLAQEGMVIRAGETIALVGSTGVSNGPHLHFEVRLGELRCDPLPLFGENGYVFRSADGDGV
ncbi:MAG: M23 family metallopeptidase [Oscillospiraceae bacterium]|nr:M23 family metallopeptidase [Oscillospiraceae bacterium]